MKKTSTIVVARYNEPLDFLKSLTGEIKVYNKGKHDIDHPFEVLANVGREAQTYVHYIVSEYDRLADLTVLIQGNPFEHCPDLLETLDRLDEVEGTVWLSKRKVIDTFTGLPNHRNLKKKVFGLPIAKYQKLLFGNFRFFYYFPAGAQFIVPREALHRHPKEFYERILNLDWNADQLPWVIERLWPQIFDYGHR